MSVLRQPDYLLKIINSANEGIYVTDRERRFLIWNDAAERITGYRRDEVLGRACHDNILSHTDQQGNSLCLDGCPLMRTMGTGTSSGPVVVYLRHKNGGSVPVEVSTSPVFDDQGNVIGGVELFEDVSQRLERERLIVERNQELEAVMNNIREGVLFIDSKGRISLCNSALSEMFLTGCETIIGTRISSLPEQHMLRRAMIKTHKDFKGPLCWEIHKCHDTHPDCHQYGKRRCRCWVTSSYRETSPHSPKCVDCLSYLNVRNFLERPKELQLGERIYSVLSSFIELRERDEIGEVLMFRDVTTEKVDAVMKCAGGAAHELRQPLQILVNTVSLMEKDLSENGETAEYLNVIRSSCARLNETIRKIGEVAQYRTKQYGRDRDILDIAKASGPGDDDESR
ncbi:MAG: PAS domain S-box protein [Chloroflexota bacterium]